MNVRVMNGMGLAVLLGVTGCGSFDGTTVQRRSEGLISITNAVGRPVSVGNSVKRSYFGYDTRGRTLAAQHVLDDISYVSTTIYGFPCATDACSAPSSAANGPAVFSETWPDNEITTYLYDAGDQEQAINTQPAGGSIQTVIAKILRNSRGQVTEVDYGDTTKSTHSYNDTTDLRPLETKTVLGATLLQDYIYAFDGNKNVTSLQDSFDSTQSATYGYDALNEVTQMVSGASTYYFNYDSIGNLVCMQGATANCGNQTYPASGPSSVRPHAISSSPGVTYSYDSNGNMSSTSASTTVTWNADNMPTKVVTSGTTINTKSFVGASPWKKVESGTTTYYLPQMRVEGNLTRKFFARFAERNPNSSSCSVNPTYGCLEFYHPDHLGSSTLVTDSTGTPVHTATYYPYGADRKITGTFPPKYQFTFKEKDATGWYDYGARTYNPVTGRFLSVDPAFGDGLNPYAYGKNNPIRFVDATGYQSQESVVEDIQVIRPPGDRPLSFFADRPDDMGDFAERLMNQLTSDGFVPIGKTGTDAGGKTTITIRGGGTDLVTSLVLMHERRHAITEQKFYKDVLFKWGSMSEAEQASLSAVANTVLEVLDETKERVHTNHDIDGAFGSAQTVGDRLGMLLMRRFNNEYIGNFSSNLKNALNTYHKLIPVQTITSNVPNFIPLPAPSTENLGLSTRLAPQLPALGPSQ